MFLYKGRSQVSTKIAANISCKKEYDLCNQLWYLSKSKLNFTLSYVKRKMEAKITSHPLPSPRNVQTAEQITNQNMEFFSWQTSPFLSGRYFIHSTYRESFAFNVNQHACQLKIHNLEMKISPWRERNSRSPCLCRLTSMRRIRVRLTRTPWVLQAPVAREMSAKNRQNLKKSGGPMGKCWYFLNWLYTTELSRAWVHTVKRSKPWSPS